MKLVVAIRNVVAVGLMAMGVAGCGTPEISPAGAKVVASSQPPAARCAPLGDVYGRAGGELSGKFVDNDALVDGAMNDVRNEAGKLGGDYVYVSHPQLGVSNGGVRSASFGGRAYRCR